MCCNSFYNNTGIASDLLYANGFQSALPAYGYNNGLGGNCLIETGLGVNNASYAQGFTNGYYAGASNRRRRCCNNRWF